MDSLANKIISNKHKFPFSLAELDSSGDKTTFCSSLQKKQDIYLVNDLFNVDNHTLDKLLEGKSSLFVLSETVEKLYGEKILHYLESRRKVFNSQAITVQTGEQNKNLNSLAYICEKAHDFSLKRDHPIVAIGGGICTDIAGLAASLFRRGVPHIKIPTTFVGIIDAGIATKNAVNLGVKKNLIGSFYPPEASIIDTTFLKTLPYREINCGIAESLKMGLVVDKNIYAIWHKYGNELRYSRLQSPEKISEEVIKRSILSMLDELSDNLYEHNSYKRAVDFGHTFSQYIEEASNYTVYHGEAVAIDMAISCQISYLKGLIDLTTLSAILQLFKMLELPIYSSFLNYEKLWASLSSIIAHRGNNLNLVIPNGIGTCVFLEKLDDLDKTCLKEALIRLENHYEEYRCNSMVS